jgi:hypothetical protein
MIERTQQRFAITPKQLAADTAYGTGKFLAFVVAAGITPHIPVWDKSNRSDNTFSRAGVSRHEREYADIRFGTRADLTAGFASLPDLPQELDRDGAAYTAPPFHIHRYRASIAHNRVTYAR